MDDKVVFVDLEVGVHDRRIHDIGAVRADGATFHADDVSAFRQFLGNACVLCGHNIVHHDMQYLAPALGDRTFALVDTLYWSPLLFPERPYHALLKDDKLLQDELNNPVSDAEGAAREGGDEAAEVRTVPTATFKTSPYEAPTSKSIELQFANYGVGFGGDSFAHGDVN